jgi:hypothetical protein
MKTKLDRLVESASPITWDNIHDLLAVAQAAQRTCNAMLPLESLEQLRDALAPLLEPQKPGFTGEGEGEEEEDK